MVTKSSHSISICPPHSPTRITKKSILKLPGAFHWRKTSRIRFWAFSYSMGEPCDRSNQLITYFIVVLSEKGEGPPEADIRGPCPLDGRVSRVFQVQEPLGRRAPHDESPYR